MAWRREHLPELEKDWSFGNPASMGDGIRAGEKVGASTDLLDEAWWFPAICWPDGRLQFMLNERMMPSQFVVNGDGKRFINEAAPYMDFAHAMIDGQRTGVTHMPCWLVTDIGSFHRYVVAGHLPDPEGAVRAGADRPQGASGRGWTPEWSRRATASKSSPPKIGVPRRPAAPDRGALQRARAHRARRRLQPRRQRLRQLLRRPDAAQPQPASARASRPYYAFQIILGDLGTSGGLRTDEFARVLRDDDTVDRRAVRDRQCHRRR